MEKFLLMYSIIMFIFFQILIFLKKKIAGLILFPVCISVGTVLSVQCSILHVYFFLASVLATFMAAINIDSIMAGDQLFRFDRFRLLVASMISLIVVSVLLAKAYSL